ncbi:MAG: Hemerythrin cation binding domain protein [Gammaproteobacteria bacterium]|jgi:hypothetical protein|nr:Hemerythrin cation binding domain protein [Gammaproteobacteria bacterium]
MNIYNYLKKDHKKVKQLFNKIILSKSPKERENYFLEIRKELELHADTEHSTFYQALKSNPAGEDDAKHGDKEHEKIKKSLLKLSKIPLKETAKWFVQLGELKNIVEHHVEEEESKMFKDAQEILSDKEAEELSLKMEELKDKMMNSKSFQTKFGKMKKKKITL